MKARGNSLVNPTPASMDGTGRGYYFNPYQARYYTNPINFQFSSQMSGTPMLPSNNESPGPSNALVGTGPSINTPGPSSSSSSTSSSSSPTEVSNKPKKTYEKWPENEQKALLSLWADNVDSLESKDARKTWDDITQQLNAMFKTKRTTDKVQKKIKYWIERYKTAKDWNLKQTGGNRRKSVHYDEIDEVLGCRDSVTLHRIAEAGSSSEAQEHDESLCEDNDSDDSSVLTKRTSRKKNKRAKKEEADNEERELFKEAFAGLAAQRTEMNKFMDNFNKNQEQQLATMNTLVGALTAFLKK